MGTCCSQPIPDDGRESLAAQLENLLRKLPTEIPDQPDNYRLVIFHRELTSLDLNQLIAWVEQIFSKGWNIHVVKSPEIYYLATVSNRYLNPLEDNLLIYRGRPYLETHCVICEDRQSNRILLPCGHLCLCELCVLLHYYPSSKPSNGLSTSSVISMNPSTNLFTKICPICNDEFAIIRDPHSLGFRY